MNIANSNSHKNSGISLISVLFVEFLSRLLHIFLQAKQLKQPLTKEISLLSKVTTSIFNQRNRLERDKFKFNRRNEKSRSLFIL